MITPNTDSTFIQVKSDNPRAFTWQNGKVAEVIEMTTQIRTIKKSSVLGGRKSESKICERTGRLDDLLLNAVDETLTQIFKEAGVNVIYDFLENKCRLKREKIAEKTEDFSVSLESLLGSAAPVIEKMILENLYRKLELKFDEKEGYEFSDYMRELRKSAVFKG